MACRVSCTLANRLYSTLPASGRVVAAAAGRGPPTRTSRQRALTFPHPWSSGGAYGASPIARVGGEGAENNFYLRQVEAGMLRQQQRDKAGNMRRGIAIPGGGEPTATGPGHTDIDSPGPELYRPAGL